MKGLNGTTTRYGMDAPYGAFGFILLAILYAAGTLCGMIPLFWGWLTGALNTESFLRKAASRQELISKLIIAVRTPVGTGRSIC
ncbi:hypothetical protein [Bacillus siamensis]|uniref:hypothetical protein n=1 Tax=Bacillus siamensis TaxID=659243 RepID=UPI0005F899D2|nr:hypothetical protein [Bacillus siamensis]